MVQKNSPNTSQMMTFLNPLGTLIPKIPFPFFADFWAWVTLGARGSASVGFWEAHQLSLFIGGGSSHKALSTPPQKKESPRSLDEFPGAPWGFWP